MTVSKENYLKIIYELGGENQEVSNKDIAEKLKISPPSVSEMIKRLEEYGYVEYQLYQGVKLTVKGLKEALRIKRVHHLWEVFLVDKLGFEIDDVHDEAEKLEHITNQKLEKALDKYLEYPKYCPHKTKIIRDK